MGSEKVKCVPDYGLKLKLNYVYPETRYQRTVPLRVLLQHLGVLLRYFLYYLKRIWQGRRPVMECPFAQSTQQIYGVPLGGIGCGTIGRGFKGEFCRYQLRPGRYEYATVSTNQFMVTIRDKNDLTIFQSLLSTYRTCRNLATWKSLLDASKCTYTGLFPRSWTEYDLSTYGIKLTCRQISPVLPHNYRDSSMPCGVFVWAIENCSTEELKVTITLAFQNGIGVKSIDSKSMCNSKPFSYQSAEGVILYHTIDKTPCSYSLGVKTGPGINISKCVNFDPNSDGKQVWEQLYSSGKFDVVNDERSPNVFGELGVAVAAQCSVPALATNEMEFVLVWDMPVVSFFCKQKKYSRYYTKIFGSDCALKMVDYALQNYPAWEYAIYEWQTPVLDNPGVPDWYKSALFNETYFVSDGGSMWFVLDAEEVAQLPEADPRRSFGRFAILEGHTHRMLNTSDVHFYASFALSMNWPHLQQSIQYDFKDAICCEMKEEFTQMYNGVSAPRKLPYTMPHDLGDPDDEPFLRVNAYHIQDVSLWRDLNPKFVLQVYRDYRVCKTIPGRQYLQDMYDVMQRIMRKSEAFDTDNDGLIENSGTPDQTFDVWVMRGPSAYCGGLWLAALYAMAQIADVLGKRADKAHYAAMLEKGKQSFEKKLWNGKCYNFDIVERAEGDIYLADQLCGQWYLKAAGGNYEVFPKDKVQTTLRTIFEHNVMQFSGGNLGAVNGFSSNGKVYTTDMQGAEVWTGITYGLAALMLHEGMDQEAWQTAGGMYKALSMRLGLSFQTPEALYEKTYFRGIGYMRPLSIWSMQLALNARQKWQKTL